MQNTQNSDRFVMTKGKGIFARRKRNRQILFGTPSLPPLQLASDSQSLGLIRKKVRFKHLLTPT